MLWNMKVTVIVLITGALVTIPRVLEELEIEGGVQIFQIITFLGLVRILRRVLENCEDFFSFGLQWKTISERWCEKFARSIIIVIIIMNKQHGNRVAIAQRRPSGEHTPRRDQGNSLKNIKLENFWPWWHTWILVEIFTSIHDRLVTEMNKCIQKTEIPELIIKGKATLVQKDLLKVTAPTNYRPITCLPMKWKILTAQIREKIYISLISRGIFPNEQKGCRKRTRGTEDYIKINTSSTKVKRDWKI